MRGLKDGGWGQLGSGAHALEDAAALAPHCYPCPTLLLLPHEHTPSFLDN